MYATVPPSVPVAVPLKLGSDEPSAFRRITPKSVPVSVVDEPATTIRPSGSTTMSRPKSCPGPTGTKRLPSVSKLESSEPSGFSLTRLKSWEPAANE